MIRSLIIDDEYPAIMGLKAQLKRVAPEVEIVGTAGAVSEAQELILKEKPDLVFLDIMLLDGTGFDLLQRLERPDFATIFTTAYDQYAIRAFRFAAVDYLLKPISSEELELAVKRFAKETKVASVDRVQKMVQNESIPAEQRKLAIHEVSSIRFVPIGQIVRIEADSNYSLVILEGETQLVSTRGLKNYSDILEGMGFFRCHKSFLINMRKVVRFHKGKQAQLEMTDGAVIPVSRSAREKLMELLEEWSL
jgi:two-component system LytT family response regulator